MQVNTDGRMLRFRNNHECGSSYQSMEGLGLKIMRLSWMEKKGRSKVAQEAAIVRRWGTKGYLTLHMNLLPPMAFQNLKRQTHSTRLLSPFNSSSSLEEVLKPQCHDLFTTYVLLLL